MTRVKICGVTRLEDARVCVDAGADAIGLNFWPRSRRLCADAVAARIARELSDRVRLVAVVVDATEDRIAAIRALGLRWIQLHGDERPDDLRPLLPEAMKALHLSRASQLEAALAWPGEELLVDARAEGLPGGTGTRCDWDLAARLAAERRIWLAGGLRPEDVADAVRRVRPFGVDVASGVEAEPGVKDPEAVAAFVRAARAISSPR